MCEKAIAIFNKSGKDRVEFKPGIKIKMTPHAPVVWIDAMYKVRDACMVTISTLDDSTNFNINSIDQKYLSGIKIRLYSMFGNAKEKII